MKESKYNITDIKSSEDSGYIFVPYIPCVDVNGNIDIDSIKREILRRNRSKKIKKILNK